jgi:trans-aconitate methyltransferase
MRGRVRDHWNATYSKLAPVERSWFQREATQSLDLIARTGVPLTAPIVDVGAGASTLVDGLLTRGYSDITLLDVAERALDDTRRRLANPGSTAVHYLVSDVLEWTPPRRFALWHDRATFHFLTEAGDRERYREVLASALETDGHAIIATFAPDGPERCSGLPVRRYSAESLLEEFAGALHLVEQVHETHITPAGVVQSFVFVRFARSF